MLQFGMPTLIEIGTLEENASLCRRLGLHFIELNMNFPDYQINLLDHIDHLTKIAENNRLYYTFHLDENMNIADFNPLIADAYLETVHRTIDAAKKLLRLRNLFGDCSQSLILNMHMHHGVHITLPERKVQLYAKYFGVYNRSYTVFRDLCESWIGKSDVTISIENTDGFLDYEKKAIDMLLESPVFGLTWDTGHSKATGEKDSSFLMDHRDRLSHFHIHDGTENPPRDHLALGDGEIDLLSRLQLAESTNARCVLETKTVASLKSSVFWLQKHGLI